MKRTIEKLSHLSILGIVIISFTVISLIAMPLYDLKFAISLAFILVAFIICLIIFRQLLGFLLVSLFLIMAAVGFLTGNLLDALFFSSVGMVIIVLFNILR